jgi:integrase/recombinase XerC
MRFVNFFDAATTKNRKISTIKSFYSWATTVSKSVKLNPTDGLSAVKVPQREMDYITGDEKQEVVSTLEDRNYKYNSRDIVIVEMLYNCGLRVSELSDVRVEDIDVLDRSFRVIGKGNKERFCFINETAYQAINIWLIDRKNILKKEKREDSGFLLITKTSDKMSVRGIEKFISKFSDSHPHAFRHGFGSVLADKGINLKVIQDLMGHSSVTTTQRYIHTSTDARRSAVNAI